MNSSWRPAGDRPGGQKQMTREEKEALIDKIMEEMKRKNEEIRRKHQLKEEDKRIAELQGRSVTNCIQNQSRFNGHSVRNGESSKRFCQRKQQLQDKTSSRFTAASPSPLQDSNSASSSPQMVQDQQLHSDRQVFEERKNRTNSRRKHRQRRRGKNEDHAVDHQVTSGDLSKSNEMNRERSSRSGRRLLDGEEKESGHCPTSEIKKNLFNDDTKILPRRNRKKFIDWEDLDEFLVHWELPESSIQSEDSTEFDVTNLFESQPKNLLTSSSSWTPDDELQTVSCSDVVPVESLIGHASQDVFTADEPAIASIKRSLQMMQTVFVALSDDDDDNNDDNNNDDDAAASASDYDDNI